jgi:AcrR family transcriptional regulator
MIEAARDLFLEQGYGATSMEQIAQRAGTSAQTVYAAFGNKPGVLRRVIDVSVGGDDADVKVLDRPELAVMLEHPDLHERIEVIARLATEAHRRSGELICLVERVSGADPAVAELAADLRSQLRIDTARIVDAIPMERLRSGLRREQLIDSTLLLGSALGWHSLVVEHGWSDEEYADWLTDALMHNLLADA